MPPPSSGSSTPLQPIVTMERDGLVVVALGSASDGAAPAYLTLDEAVSANAVDIHELGGGTVPTVAVETKDTPVVIFGGDTIVGGKQNRIVNVTIWLTAMKTTPIPVTCLEHGRWDPGAEARFASGPKADLRLRSMLNAQVHAQARAMAGVGAPRPGHRSATWRTRASVWDEVASKHERASTTSRTGALHDLYAREAADVETLRRAFPYPDRASGAAIGIGGRLVALELFDRPRRRRSCGRGSSRVPSEPISTTSASWPWARRPHPRIATPTARPSGACWAG